MLKLFWVIMLHEMWLLSEDNKVEVRGIGPKNNENKWPLSPIWKKPCCWLGLNSEWRGQLWFPKKVALEKMVIVRAFQGFQNCKNTNIFSWNHDIFHSKLEDKDGKRSLPIHPLPLFLHHLIYYNLCSIVPVYLLG